MKNVNELKAIATFVLDAARKAGADQAAVTISAVRRTKITTVARRDRNVPDRSPASIESAPGTLEMKLETFIGKKGFACTTTRLALSTLGAFVARAVEVTRVRPDDEFEGLPAPEQLATNIPVLDAYSPDCLFLNTAQKINLVADAEAAAFAVDPRIFASQNCGYAGVKAVAVYGNTHGFLQGFVQSNAGLWVVVVAKENDQMQVGHWSTSHVKRSMLASPAHVGRMAAQRALRGLGGRKVPTQKVPVVFDNQTASMLLAEFAGTLSGEAIFQKQSFMMGKLGQQIGNAHMQITDDPFRPFGPGSTPFGEHGIQVGKRTIVDGGRLQHYFVDAKEGRKLGMAPNGGGPTNFYLHAGAASQNDIISSVTNGFFCTSLMGHGFNGVTGGVSFGASGMWIENGKLAFPVHEITVAGDMNKMWHNIEAVGSDLEFDGGINAPSLLIGGMTVAGD